MKKITLLFLVFIVVFTAKMTAQDLSLSFESSEGFTLGEIDGQNGWAANPTYSPFVNIVDTKSTDGSNSLYFENDPNGPIPDGGISGAVSPTINFDDVTFTVDLFVESGQNTSEFDVILQSVASNALTSRVAFVNGDILLVDALPTPQFVNAGTYTPDVWFELKIVHDFINGTIEYSIDDAVIYTGNVVNGTDIDQMLLYSSFNQTGIYVDNVNFTTTLDVEEFEVIDFEFFISNTQLNITANQSFDQINIFDLSGKQVMNKNLSSNDENISIQSLASGLYLAKVQIGNQTKTFKFIK